MQAFLTYWFWPNPAGWTYGTQSVVLLLTLSAALVVASFGIRLWRRKLPGGMTKVLSRSWSAVCIWFGLIGFVLIVSRVEQIQFFSMRVLWAVWALALVLYVLFQLWQFRRRHYSVMKQAGSVLDDDMARYLPRKKRR